MARIQVVMVNGKAVTVQEKALAELESLAREWAPAEKGKGKPAEGGPVIGGEWFAALYERLPRLFPELTRADVENARVRELEALWAAFAAVNFTGLRKVLVPVLKRL